MPDALPFAFPPRRLRVEAAAYYMGMSETAFRALGIEPVRIRGTVGWLREDLDAWLDQHRPVAPADAPPPENPWHKPCPQPPSA